MQNPFQPTRPTTDGRLGPAGLHIEQARFRVWPWLETNQQKWVPGVLLFVALLLWGVSLPATNLNQMTDIGLLSVLPWTFYAALLVVTASFCWIVFRWGDSRWTPFLHLAVLIWILHGTPTVLYGTLRYSWAWKHVGLVDYIQRHGSVDPNISLLNAYHNWPGFFALNALLTELAGLESALVFAPWATVFFNLLFLGALVFLFRSFTTDPRLVWLSTWFFFISNWVGQDYFAPQTFAYLLYLIMFALLLRYFRSAQPPSPAVIRRWLRYPRLADAFHRVIARGMDTAQPARSLPAQRTIVLALLLLLMVVTTFSHQLTPMIMLAALGLLVIFQLVFARSLPVIMGVLVVAWIFLVASAFMGSNLRSITSSFGNLEGNVSKSLISLQVASEGQVLISMMGRGLTLLVAFLAGLGFIQRLRTGSLDLAAVVLLNAPFLLLVANSYGGEILFRIYLFSLPVMAFFTAGLFFPRPRSGRTVWTPLLAAVVSVVLCVGFLFAYYGKERQYYFSPEEVAAANYLYDNAVPGALIVEGTRNYPGLFRNYELYTYVPIAREPVDSRQIIINSPSESLERWMENPSYPAAYLIITRSMKAEVDMVGAMPAGSLDLLETELRQSGRFNVIFENANAAIYTLREDRE